MTEQIKLDIHGRPYVLRWVVTHIGRFGMRTLAHACQGRHTYDTREQAQAWIDAALRQNREEDLRKLYGFPLEPREAMCYPGHHDPIGIYWE